MSPRRVRRLVAPAVASVVLLALAAPIALADSSLRIVISNDDGWIGADGSSTPLIVALRNALAADGHEVTVVAPATDQSATGTRLTFATPLALLNPAPRVWTVSGSPTDAVFLAGNVLFSGAAPDLIVSGINPGGNYSSVANHSGTVGAAIAGLELGVPAIAVSIDGSPEQSVALKDTVARYTAELVDTLADHTHHDESVLPPGIGLNVNYPGATPVTGTRITRQDPNSYIKIGYTNTTGALGEPGVYTVAIGAPLASPTPGSDWEALRAGKISITPIDADRTADQTSLVARRWNFLTRVLEGTGR
jgi:5'/3'-nucleotidase SurE